MTMEKAQPWKEKLAALKHEKETLLRRLYIVMRDIDYLGFEMQDDISNNKPGR